MKNMKRIVAMIAMLAVLLSSFAFAEGEIAVEAVESIDAAVVMAEAPAEEAAAEEVNAELLAEEAVAPAAECVEHGVYCFMPDVCVYCGQAVQGVSPKHVDNLYSSDPVVLPDAPTLHGYFCSGCLDYVDVEEHKVDCRQENPGVCSVCGYEVGASLIKHEALSSVVTAIPGTSTHGRYCSNCKQYLYVDNHYVDCLNKVRTNCEACGVAVGEEAIVHDGRFDTGASSICTKCGESKGLEQVLVISTLEMGEGESYTLTASVVPNVDAFLAYVVTEGSCVTVNRTTGEVKAVSAGTATITVTATGLDGKTVSAQVKVSVKAAPTSVTLSASELDLYLGDKAQLIATLKSADSAAKLRWESSNNAVAVVNENGVITPISAGEATITVITYNGLKASCKVSVTTKPEQIEVEESELRMYYKQNFNLNTRLVDKDGKECPGELSYESSSPSVVEVSDRGKLTVKKNSKGTTVIITITGPNKLSRDIRVTVCDVPSKVKLEESKATLNVGETYQLKPIIDDDEATVYTYTTSKKTVATVDKDGLITAVGEGSATITVQTHNKKKATLKLTVKDPYAPESVELNLSGTYYLALGEEMQMEATLYPETAKATLSWKSASTKVATVDENGVVSGIKTGSAKITVTTHNGKKDTVTIKVVDPKVVSAVELEETGTVLVGKGETISLNANILPETAETTLSWKSSSTKVATVDADGVVEGIKTGTATITVTSKNGKKDTVKVKVIDPTIADSVVLSESGTVTTNVGEPVQLNAEVLPATAETELSWSTSSKKVATVDENGLVMPIKKGTATITVKTDNGKKDTVKIKVVDEHKPTSISLPSVSGLTVGKQTVITPEIKPFDAKTVLTWSSSNEKVLTVEDGKLTAVGAGTATITVETHNGKEDSVKLTVGEAPKAASIEAALIGTGIIGIGEKVQISATVMPEDAAYTLSYASSNAAVAKVDTNGIVTGVAAGSCTITVKTDNGLSAVVNVTVDPNKDPNSAVEISGTINGSISKLSNLVGELKGSGSSYTDASGALSVTCIGDKVKFLEVKSGKYSLYGVKTGMSVVDAVAALKNSGVTVYDAAEDYIGAGKGSCVIEVYADASTGKVSSICVYAI